MRISSCVIDRWTIYLLILLCKWHQRTDRSRGFLAWPASCDALQQYKTWLCESTFEPGERDEPAYVLTKFTAVSRVRTETKSLLRIGDSVHQLCKLPKPIVSCFLSQLQAAATTSTVDSAEDSFDSVQYILVHTQHCIDAVAEIGNDMMLISAMSALV